MEWNYRRGEPFPVAGSVDTGDFVHYRRGEPFPAKLAGDAGIAASIFISGGGAVSTSVSTQRFASVTISGGGSVLVQISANKSETVLVSGGGSVVIDASANRIASISVSGGGQVSIVTSSLVIQFARPISDVDAGGWEASTGTDLFAMVDEEITDDGDYIFYTGVGDPAILALGSISSPDPGDVTLIIRALKV